MWKVFCLIFAIIACIAQLKSSPLSEKVLSNIRGTPATQNQFPFQAAIYFIYNGTRSEQYISHGCCGSILGDRWIITAAECVDGIKNISEIFVVVGTQNRDKNGTVYQIESFQTHPDFIDEHFFYKNNVALLRTNESIQFNNQTQPIELYTEEVNEFIDVQINGWVR